MKLALGIAEKLLLMLAGDKIPSSSLKNPAITKMLDDGVLSRQISGRTKTLIYLENKDLLPAYLKNHFGINDLNLYIGTLQKEEATRNDFVSASSDSKIKQVRTFKGFVVNSYEPVKATLNNEAITIHPHPGLYTFVHDFEAFVPDKNITIVGMENPENFNKIHTQKHLFPGINPLFVSRYPQSGDLIKWLKIIPNNYLHFGDYDFAGLNIYVNEFKSRLGTKAKLFIPDNFESMLSRYGNRNLYDNQLHLAPGISKSTDHEVIKAFNLIHKYKKGLEQEIFIRG
jgi:hypothetical protein